MATFGLWCVFAPFPAIMLLQPLVGDSALAQVDNQWGEVAAATLCAGLYTAGVVGWVFRSYMLGFLVAVVSLASATLLALAGHSLWYLLALPVAIILWNITLISAISPAFARRRFPPRDNECGFCGYCMIGLRTTVCPECGNANDRHFGAMTRPSV
jgi:hypothetical protein